MKLVKSVVLAVAFLSMAQGAALAQGNAPAGPSAAVSSAGTDTRALGVGLVIIGAALGIGGLTKSAVESIARQPEMYQNIQTTMIISAALIEGVAFFALIIIMIFLKPLLPT